MKINTGNFGNNGMQLGRVGIENPEALSQARAEQDAANSTMRAQDTLQQGYRANSQAAQNRAEAWSTVGKVAVGIGQGMVEQAQQLARQKAELQLQDYQDYHEGAINKLEQDLADGNIDSTGFKNAFEKIGEGWKGENIQDLTGADKARLTKGMQTLDRRYTNRADNVYGRALHVERINAADQTVAGYGAQLLNPNADISQVNAQVDEFFNRKETRALYGASWATKYHAAKQSMTTNYYQAQIEAHNNDNGALEQLRGAVTQNVEDIKTRTALFNAIDSKQSRNEARAQAAQNHADSVATRREMQAGRLQDNMNLRIANGEIPSDEDWQHYEQSTEGTSAAGTSASLKQAVVATQTLSKMDPRQAQAVLDQESLRLQQHGGTKNEYAVLKATQTAIDRRATMVKTDPQRVGAMDAGQPLVPFTPGSILQNPGEAGVQLQQRMTNAQAVTQKYGPTAGQHVLTNDEIADTKTFLSQATPDQVIQFWRNTNASAGPDVTRQLARDVGSENAIITSVADLATTPKGWATAQTVQNGVSLLYPRDGAPKVKAPKDDDISSAIAAAYPDLTPQEVQQRVPLVKANHVGLGKDADQAPTADDMQAVLGERVSVFGSKMTAPPGVDGDVFSANITKQVGRLPADQAQDIRNHVQRGTYAFIADKTGNYRLVNTTTQRMVAVGGKPFVVESN